MSEQKLRGSFEEFQDWCRRCGHYNALAAFDRYQMYEERKETRMPPEQVVRQQAASCED